MPRKADNCEHQFPDVGNCAPAYRNYYKCAKCGSTWQDDWSAMCDDDCPYCGARHMSPIMSEPVAPCACKYLNGKERNL